MSPPALTPSARLMVHGHLGRGNVGDEAMLQVILRLIRKRWPHSEILLVYGPDTRPQPRLDGRTVFVPRRFWEMVTRLCACQYFIIAGGTHLTCFGRNKRAKLAGLVRHLLLIVAARLFGAKVMMLSVGIGPLNSRAARYLVKSTLSLVHFISYRDEASKKTLAMLQYRGLQKQCSDAAFFIKSRPVARAPIPPRLGISILPYFSFHMRDAQGDHLLIEAFSEAIRAWLDYFPAGTVCLLPVCAQPGSGSDAPITNALAKVFISDARVQQSGLTGNLDAFLSEVSALSHFIGMRYHSVLLACILKVPTINVAYHEKSRMLASQLMMPEEAVVPVEKALDGQLIRQMPRFCREPEFFLGKQQRPEFAEEDILPSALFGSSGASS